MSSTQPLSPPQVLSYDSITKGKSALAETLSTLDGWVDDSISNQLACLDIQQVTGITFQITGSQQYLYYEGFFTR